MLQVSQLFFDCQLPKALFLENNAPPRYACFDRPCPTKRIQRVFTDGPKSAGMALLVLADLGTPIIITLDYCLDT